MKGFILSVKNAKNEDTIVSILTQKSSQSYYRFFGARHSIISLGFLIDFEVEGEDSRFLPRLRRVSHLSFDWLKDNSKLLLWHQFISILEPHLRDIEELNECYFNLLLEASNKWGRQNPKRVAIESYIKLLIFEGRVHLNNECYICQTPLEQFVGLMAGFKMCHPQCIYSQSLIKNSIIELFQTQSTIKLNDKDVDYLFNVLLKGI